MRTLLLMFFLLAGIPSLLQAQTFAFGIKGGLTAGFQKWDSFERDPLFSYHGIAFIETAPEENLFALFAQAGFHERGSAIRNRNNFAIDLNGNVRPYNGPIQKFIFRNVSLAAGAKKKFELGNKFGYYMIGIRGEFTVDTNLEEYEQYITRGFFQFPFEGAVRKINYGPIVGGGFEFPFTDLIGGIIEFSVNPDLSQQYFSPALQNPITHPITGNPITVGERKIMNTSFEITVGFRFLRKVEYID